MAQPLPVFAILYSDVIRELNAMAQVAQTDIFAMRKLRDLEELALEIKKTDLAHAFSALGSIAAATRNVAKMRQNYKKALQYSSNPTIQSNYAVALLRCDLHDEALEFAEDLYVQDVNNEIIVNFLAGVAFEMGDLTRYEKYSGEYKKLTQKDHELYEEYLEEMREIKKLSEMCLSVTLRSCEAGA